MNTYTSDEITGAERFARPWLNRAPRDVAVQNMKRYGNSPISPYAAPNTFEFESRDKAEARRCAAILETTL